MPHARAAADRRGRAARGGTRARGHTDYLDVSPGLASCAGVVLL